MTDNSRPSGLHPQTWRRLNRAAFCTGSPPPPITETLSNRFRDEHGILSDGNFINEQQHSEAFSSSFVLALTVGTPFHGEMLNNFALCLSLQGIVLFAPLLDKPYPHIYGLCFDTNLPLSMDAAIAVGDFIAKEGQDQEQHYSRSWARSICRHTWHGISRVLRKNLFDISHMTFE